MAERVDCLYRVSTTKQVDHDELNQADIPVQRKACRDFAEKMGWIIVNEEQETGVSGYKVSANDRDKLQLIKKRAEQGKFDILLVFMFDRLGRKSDETPFVVEWFVKHGVRVWSVNEGEQRFESHTDRLTNYIRYWQADGESQKTSIRTKTAMGQMVQEGRFRGGGVPYGYRLAPSGILNKRKHEVWKLEIDEDEARVVRMMFNLCVGSGYGRCKIANMISGQGIKTRTGSNWHEATVGHILHNVAYTGVLRSGESQSEICALRWVHTLISNLKAFLQGTYHGLGKKHLQSYFDEFCFRFNRRFRPHQLFPRLLCAVAASNILGYGDLTR